MTQRVTSLESILRLDRGVVLAGVVGVAAVAWGYTVYLAWGMGGGMAMGTSLAMPQTAAWGAVDFVLMFVMWAVMMVAMMVPTAAPMILVFAKVNRTRRDQQRPFIPTGVFLSGYVIIWSAFALLATLAQWLLHSASLLSPMMVSSSPIMGGTLLLAAGIFQWSPLKYACVTQCRTPMGFIMTEWREGARGAHVMGLKHGTYCLGCCWVLMALLFVLGVMNLLWIAALAAFVLVEKVVRPGPAGNAVSWAAGFGLVFWGAWTIVTGVI